MKKYEVSVECRLIFIVEAENEERASYEAADAALEIDEVDYVIDIEYCHEYEDSDKNE